MFVLLAIMVALFPPFLQAAGDTQVRIAQGVLAGTAADGVLSFKGIPYAAPVVGENRWRPPQPAAPWEGNRAAAAFGPACPQPQRRDRRTGIGRTSEDCLSLNVWAPAGAKDAPVMVWIHGGAFRIGASSQRGYDGASFARRGVVLVTVNYRLGRLGIFAHPALAESGNFSLMDQVAALEWVQANVAAFGGNPGNVTIFGESAGGASVLHLLTADGTGGLFHRAILQSGGGHQLNGHLSRQRLGKPSLLDQGIRFAGSLDAAGLRAMPLGKVIDEGTLGGGVGSVAPVIDGHLVTRDPGLKLAAGAFQHVPVLVGANSFEASVLAAFGTTPEQAVAAAKVDPDRYAALYPDGDASAAWGDAAFVAGARHVARSVANRNLPAYLYHFDYVPEVRRGKVPGAAHGADVLYVFDALDAVPVVSRFLTDEDRAFAARVQSYWVNFARNGDPNGEGLPHWPRYDASTDELLFLGEEIGVRRHFRAPQLDFHQARWEQAERLAGAP